MTPVEPTKRNVAMMLDIETLALSTDACVTQIGVCVADLDTREYLVEPINFWPSTGSGGKIDFDTVSWWMQQDRKVAASVFNKDVMRTPPGAIFGLLKSYCEAHKCTVWGSPAMFDLPILTNFFGNKKPWKYNDERCMMTMYKLLDPSGAIAPPPNTMAHDAAADAKWQMEYLFNLHSELKCMQASSRSSAASCVAEAAL